MTRITIIVAGTNPLPTATDPRLLDALIQGVIQHFAAYGLRDLKVDVVVRTVEPEDKTTPPPPPPPAQPDI